ncbi:peptide ABC transporter substrate-binding protein [Rummeliibacillus suwonensis]|uniref:peptide ABC transporter substrate-binding protein n=1 Tax=Rummeliibacillus suwonensis TaxID=1306154 RepID=UPI0011B445B3|nr:peptide ABC transporter substrate-binding protein [Rummeliibacillus suwonensis]
MKKSKLVWLLSLVLVLSVFLAACGGGDDKDKDNNNSSEDSSSKLDAKQELNLNESAEIPTADSALATDTVGFTVLNNISEGLYRLNKDNVAEPAIAAEEPKVSEDGTVYTFKLRDAKWSDGSQVTANDFEFAWKRAIDPKTGSEYGPYMMNGVLKNAEKISTGKAKPDTLGVKAVDDKTLEVTLEKPIPYFLSLMAFPTFLPAKEEFVKEKGKQYAKSSDNLLYNGPFTLNDWDGTGLKWTYKKNESYWDKDNVKLDTINVDVVKETSTAVNLYNSGEKDRAGLDGDFAAQYANDKNLVKFEEATVFYLKFNQKRNGKTNTPLANLNIREALSQAFNKEELTKTVLANGSEPANYLVPKNFTFDENKKDFRDINGDLTKFDATAAKDAWEKGLKELGVKKLTLEFLGDDTDLAKKMDEYMKNQLEKNLPGLTIKLKEVPFQNRIDLDTNQDYDIQFAGWGPDYQDPLTFISLWTSDSAQNKMGYASDEYDKLVKEASTTYATDPEKRWQALADAEKLVVEKDAAIAPVYQRARVSLQQPYVKDLVQHNFGPDFSYKWAYISGKE